MTLMRAIAAVLLAMLAVPAAAQAGAGAAELERLDAEIAQTESVRAVKRLQVAYAHFVEFGMWDEAAKLFAARGELVIGDKPVRGQAAIQKYLIAEFGRGHLGLVPGQLTTRMQLTPVVNLSADGNTAKARWHEVSMLGQLGEEAHWEGGISENDYVREGGRWKIARLHLYPMYAGTYETGWYNLEDDLPIVPFHYTADEAGVPILPLPAKTSAGPVEGGLPALAARVRRLAAEDAVMRLQSVYGYYVDQKMWTDVTDLFTEDGTREIVGTGTWKGEQGIRRSFGTMASTQLNKGEVNEHLQMHLIVTVSPDGKQAWARGFELGMLGENNVGGWWAQAVFINRYVERDGIWRIAEMRLYPKLRSDYYQGWGKSQLAYPAVPKGYEPDLPSTIALPAGKAWVPAFGELNPATGKAIAYPASMEVLGADLAAPIAAAARQAPAGVPGADLSTLRTGLARARAVDAAENVSHAFGYYLDDFNWDGASALFARTGRRGKYQVGFYVSPEHIRKAELTMYGPPRTPRTSIQIHLRIQPVVDPGPDGLTSKLRTRLFSFSSRKDGPGNFQSGMYPNDTFVLQDGVWKFQHQSIDELYFRSDGYQNGWAKVREVPKQRIPPSDPPTIMDKLRAAYPPDVDILDMGLRAKGFGPGPDFVEFPDLKAMWFHYPNPVSGRLPPNYCPDHSTCYQQKPLFEDQAPTLAP